MLPLILFFIFAALCVGGAINLLVQKHPINSALSLIVVMGSLALIYLLLGAEFVAAVQVIVYAGAVMVLFVFVIMLLNAGEEERAAARQPRRDHARRSGADHRPGHYGSAGQPPHRPGSHRHRRSHGHERQRRLRQSAGRRASAVPRLPAALRSHVDSDSDRHHGRRRAGAEGGTKWFLFPITWC